MPSNPPSAPGGESPDPGGVPPGLAAGSRSRPSTPSGSRTRRAIPWLIGLAAAVGLGLSFSARYLVDTEPLEQLELSGRVAVLPFAIDAPRSDDWASWGLAALVTEALETSEGVQVVPMRHLDRAFTGRDLRLDDPGGRSRARELAQALGARLVADITFRRRAEEVLLDARFLGAAGEVVESRQISGADPIGAADRLSLAMSAALAPDLAPVGFERALTGDPFVDRLYAEGVHVWMEAPRGSDRGASATDGSAATSSAPGSGASTARSRARAARPYFEIALRHQPVFLRAKARLVDCLRLEGEIRPARALAARLLQESQSRGLRAVQAQAFRALGLLAAIEGEPRAAEEQYRQAHRLELARQDPLGQAEALAEQARLALAEGRLARAQELLVEVRGLGQKTGDLLGQIDALLRLGSVMLSDGRLEAAGRVLEEARGLAVQIRDPWEEHRLLASLGEVAWREGEVDAAVDAWQQALVFYRQQEDDARILLLTSNLAQALLTQGDLPEAESLFQDQLELSRAASNPRLEAKAALRLAWLSLRQGYPFQARGHLDTVLELDHHLDDRDDLRRVIAWLAYEQGNYSLAVETQRQLQRQSTGGFTEDDAAFLEVYEGAARERQRLPVPGEEDYVGS